MHLACATCIFYRISFGGFTLDCNSVACGIVVSLVGLFNCVTILKILFFSISETCITWVTY